MQSIAIRTKALLTANDSEKIKKLFNWKTLNTLRFITKAVVQLHKESSDYPQLAPPLIDLLKGVSLVFPSHTYIPIRLHFLQLLIDLSSTTGFCIPILPLFIPLLKLQPDKHQRNGLRKTIDLDISIKMDKSKGMDDVLLNRILELLCFWISTREAKKGYPEWSIVLERLLSAIRKTTENKDVREGLKRILADLREGRKLTIESRKSQKALSEKDGFGAKNNKDALKQKLLQVKLQSKPNLSVKMRQEYEKRRVERDNLIKMKILAEKEEDNDGIEDDGDLDDEEYDEEGQEEFQQ